MNRDSRSWKTRDCIRHSSTETTNCPVWLWWRILSTDGVCTPCFFAFYDLPSLIPREIVSPPVYHDKKERIMGLHTPSLRVFKMFFVLSDLVPPRVSRMLNKDVGMGSCFMICYLYIPIYVYYFSTCYTNFFTILEPGKYPAKYIGWYYNLEIYLLMCICMKA